MTNTSIQLQFVSEAGAGASLLRWFSHGRFSHVDVIIPYEGLLGARMDNPVNDHTGVQIRPSDYATFTDRLVVTVPATVREAFRFHDFLARQIGKPYDWRAILAFCTARNWRDPNAWFCSELIAAALEQAGLIEPLLNAVNKITPCDLALLLSAMIRIN